MINWILTRMEENPNTIFYGKELEERFSESMQQAIKDRLLRRTPSALDSYDRGLNVPYLVVENEDGLEAINEDDPEAEPIGLVNDDLARYKLDLEAFARCVQQANKLTGNPSRLTDRLFFLGEMEIEDVLVACVLAFINDSPITHQTLTAIPTLLPSAYRWTLVVCPSHLPTPTECRQLEDLHIRVILLQSDNPIKLPSLNTIFKDISLESSEFQISDNYRSVSWQGQEFGFTPQQAKVVGMLHRAYKTRTPDVSWNQIRQVLETYPDRMSDIFKTNKAWKTLIVPGKTRGTYRLNL